jgi:hypothetical protein
MKKVIITGLALLAISTLSLFLPACCESGKEKFDRLSETEKSCDDQTTVYTDNVKETPGEEQPVSVCLSEKLNVRAEPGTASKVVGVISRGERVQQFGDIEYSRDDPSGYAEWANIRLSDGTEGWVAEMFVIDIEAYEKLEDVERAAKTGDSARTEAAVKAFIKKVEVAPDYIVKNKYYRSPDGGKFALSTDIGGFIITVGYGVSSRAPLGGIQRTGEWQYGSKYWSVRTGDCAAGGFEVYETDSMKPVLKTYIWLHNYEFLGGSEILVWPTTIDDREIDYPLVGGPATEPDYKSLAKAAGINYFDYYYAPCLMVYTLETGDSYMAAASDFTTLTEAEGYACNVTLKPTERFTTNPLFGPVSKTEVYKEWVGKPVNGCLSEE